MDNNKFKERLCGLLSGESVRGFAAKCGLSDSTIRHYLAGTSEPTLGKIEQIANACNVSVGWLAAGEEGAALDEALLKNVIEIIEGRLDEKKISLSPSKKSELICMLYEEVLRNDSVKGQLVQKAHRLLHLLAA